MGSFKKRFYVSFDNFYEFDMNFLITLTTDYVGILTAPMIMIQFQTNQQSMETRKIRWIT